MNEIRINININEYLYSPLVPLCHLEHFIKITKH